ncbi:MAG: glucans biosynthesis glucosyltransferase MdoH [Pseudomonadota bacterium]
MNHTTSQGRFNAVSIGLGEDTPNLTPAGLQDRRLLARRRAIVLALNAVTVGLLFWGMLEVFRPAGYSLTDIIIIACAMLGAPWTVMGVWNALLGIWLLHGRRDGLTSAAPHLPAAETDRPLTSRVALAMTVRNEDPARSFHRLAAMRESLDATGQGDRFDAFILSDTSDPAVAAEEEALFAAMRPALGGPRAHYRRRTDNTGFKAGNVHEFLSNQGRDYDLYLPLDSDSLMGGDVIVRMTRIMEAYPSIGILQSLAVGTPSPSLFARLFQFGMRHGMRSFTMGAAWWQGDCGPYWGHNAVIRLDAFRRHCRLPVLPGGPPLGGHILSHDQIEAVLMRRAGYEVRVIPVEDQSFEDNPPTLMDFTQRDLRWCQGNMQYWRLLGMKGLLPTSRFQVFSAIMMYFSAPAWMLMTIAATGKIVEGIANDINISLGIAMFFIMLTVSLVPKLLGMLDIALTRGGASRYGGRLRFALGGLAETLSGVLMAPVVAFRVTLFLIGLAFGRRVMWTGQNRDAYRLTWGDAARGLWPQTVFGVFLLTAIVVGTGWGTVVWAAPMLAGLMLSIPFAVFTGSPEIGRVAERFGLCAIPDEVSRPEILGRLDRIQTGEALPKAA